ncbi:MAG: cation-transporting P-type ATPase, partial [Verrucomicrobiota bacterium]
MALRSAVCLVAALAGWALHSRYQGASTAAFMIAFLAGGWDLTRQVWSDLRVLRFDTRFLMLLVVPGSVAVDAWGEAALLLVLFSASAAMEEFAGHRTRREINALLRRAPKSARRIDHGRELPVAVESLRPGDVVRVTANEQVPVDVAITAGESACDESSLTGEADPIPKRPGETAYAGTLNLWGTLEATVLRPASDSALQRIIRLIEEAQHL